MVYIQKQIPKQVLSLRLWERERHYPSVPFFLERTFTFEEGGDLGL